MHTRCPVCASIYKIHTETLRAKQGWVRCGNCSRIFNALDSLFNEAPTAANVPTSAASHSSGWPAAASYVPSYPATADGGSGQPPAYQRPPAASATAAASPHRWADSDDARLWLWLPLITATVVVLLFQAFYIFRIPLAANLPALRPLFSSVCWVAGCELPYPAKPDLISIESSNLRALPDAKQFQLTATLRNKARYAQQYPMLELTLVNENNMPVIVKSLTPKDYLPPRARTYFQGESDLNILLRFDANGFVPTTFRLYVYYR